MKARVRARNVLGAPFPWFGGKRRVADVVWRAFGDVPNYVEPFFGSGAVLLGRPHEARIETVNDVDAYAMNFWRAVTLAPEETARAADWPVSEVDLHARHKWLVAQDAFRERMRGDPEYFDPKVAGWWVWGICQWIGDGWCRGSNAKGLPYLRVNPTKTQAGQGVHAESVLKRKIPNLKNAGQGVHLPELDGGGTATCSQWFSALQARLRRVRFACGDWERVLGPSVLGKGKGTGGRRPCAVFLDPPYSHEFRAGSMYASDARGLSDRVRDWATAHGDDPELRIALCGYEGEHEMPASWVKFAWAAARGYAGEDNENAERERVWFSPYCLPIDGQQGLFG